MHACAFFHCGGGGLSLAHFYRRNREDRKSQGKVLGHMCNYREEGIQEHQGFPFMRLQVFTLAGLDEVSKSSAA